MSKSKQFLILIVTFAFGIASVCVLAVLQSAPDFHANVPYLRGSDGQEYFIQAQKLADGDNARIISHYVGYQLYLARWFTWFGADLAVAFAANATFMLLTNYFLFRASQELGLTVKAACISVVFFILTTEFVSYTVLLLREPAIALANCLFMFGIVRIANVNKNNVVGITALATACFLLVAFRTTQLFFIIIVLVLLFPNLKLRIRMMLITSFLALMFATPIMQSFSTYQIDAAFLFQTVVQNEVIMNRLGQGDLNTGGIVGRVAQFLDGQPFVVKVALFPLTTSVQYFLPFDFWSMSFWIDHMSYFFDRNLKIIWLFFLGPLFLYCIRKYPTMPNGLMKSFLQGGIVSYILVAIIYGGAIPRYGAPMLIFVFPAMAYWYVSSLVDGAVQRSLKQHFRSYVLLLILLVVAYILLLLVR